MRSDVELIENIDVPCMYADDIGNVEVVGDRVRITFIQYRRVNGIKVAIPVFDVIRPTATAGLAAIFVAQAVRDHASIKELAPN